MTSKYFVAPRPTVQVYPSGREVCNKTAAGKREYRSRTLAMAKRQGWRCGLCGLPMGETTATYDHAAGRGFSGAKRDDRIEVDGKWQNAAVHFACNSAKGSQRIPYVITQRGGVAMPGGRPHNLIRHAWALRYGLTERQESLLDERAMERLSYSTSDEARRILLGITVKYSDAPAPMLRNDRGKLPSMAVRE